MKWSKLKQRIEEGFADSVRGRVEIWTTRYRAAHDGYGEAWITVDGEKIGGMGSLRFEIDRYDETQKLLKEGGVDRRKAYEEAEHLLHRQGNMGLWSVNTALFDYLSMPFDDILASDIALIRGLGFLDRRLGKRRLAAFDTAGQAELVRDLHLFRCCCEGVRPS